MCACVCEYITLRVLLTTYYTHTSHHLPYSSHVHYTYVHMYSVHCTLYTVHTTHTTHYAHTSYIYVIPWSMYQSSLLHTTLLTTFSPFTHPSGHLNEPLIARVLCGQMNKNARNALDRSTMFCLCSRPWMVYYRLGSC